METLQRTANSGSVSTGFNIDNSVKVENDNREYLRWTNFSSNASSARKKKFTMSCWLKRTELGRQMMFWSTAANGYFSFDAGDTLVWYQQYVGSATQLGLRTTRVFRDTSAWYHLMIVVDTAQSTEANRVKMYVNGVQETVFGTPNTYPSQGAEASNLYEQHLLLGEWGGGSTGFSGYIAEYYFLSEIAASPTDLGEFDEDSGIWIPKEYDGTISSPSHFLEFKDGSDLGTATSGLDADTMNNIAAADQSTDTPTNNFATINTLPFYNQGTFSFPNGATNIKRSDGGGDGWTCVFSTIAVNKGKWYAEMEVLESPSLTMYGYASVVYIQSLAFPHFYLGTADTASAGYYSNGDGANDSIYEGDNFPSAGVQSSAGTIIGIAIDCDNNKIHFSNNGTYTNSSNPVNNTNGFPMPDDYVYFAQSSYTGAKTYKTNLGGYTVDGISSAASDANGYGTFEYAPPSGYYALCTKNLAEYG